MPCFNHARYVAESIRSVLNQTEGDLELIVVDDGSTDGSPAVIAEAALGDERVKPLYHSVNLGASRSRNDALDLAQGEYVAFCDADDIWLPTKLENQLELLAPRSTAGRPLAGVAYGNANDSHLAAKLDNQFKAFSSDLKPDIVYGDARIIDGQGRETGALFSHRFPVPGSGSGNLFNALCERNFINMQSALLRREIIRPENYFDPTIRWVEDWLFWIKLARTASFIYSPKVLGLYRVHEASSASAQPQGVIRNRVKVYLATLHYCVQLPRQVLSRVFYHLGVGITQLNEPVEEAKSFYEYSAQRCFKSALMCNPFNLKAAARLILCALRK
jgi:glycosyltransferase involved in cell wall biosynthesis